MYKFFPYKDLDHKEVLLYGFHFNFIFIFILAVIRDLLAGNQLNASINFTSFCLTLFSYYLLHVKHYTVLPAYMLMVIAAVPLMLIIYINDFDNLPIIYFVVLPLATFFLLEFKQVIKVNLAIYVSVIILLYVIYQQDPNTPVLSNPAALINLTFASILIMGFGLFYHLAIETSIKALVKSNKQKDLLLKEVHHRVKNNLNVTASILGLQAKGKSEETQEELSRSKSRIEAIAIVHEMLYKHDDFEEVVFNEYVEKLASILTTDYRVTVEVKENNNLTLALNNMMQFGLIINEMVTNTLKYAKNEKGVKITIALEREADQYHFLYGDNGEVPIDAEQLKSDEGLGLRLIDLSVRQLGGEREIRYEKGLQYAIIF